MRLSIDRRLQLKTKSFLIILFFSLIAIVSTSASLKAAPIVASANKLTETKETPQEPEVAPAAIDFYNQAIAADKQHQRDLALALYNKAIKLEPKFAWAYANRGSLYRDRMQPDQAFKDYKKAHRLDPKDTITINNIAHLYSDLREWGPAIQWYTQGLRLAPKDANMLTGRGHAFEVTANDLAALKDFRKSTQLEPEDAEHWNNLALVEGKLLRFTQCLKHADRALKLDPENRKAVFLHNDCLAQLERSQNKSSNPATPAVMPSPTQTETASKPMR